MNWVALPKKVFDMHINITFLIQAINFLITYKLLSMFLFKPIISSIEQKKAKSDFLKNSIKEKEDELVSMEKQKIENIATFQDHVKQSYPFISPVRYDKPLEMDREKKVEQKKEKISDQDKLQKKVVDWLVSKVPHGY